VHVEHVMKVCMILLSMDFVQFIVDDETTKNRSLHRIEKGRFFLHNR